MAHPLEGIRVVDLAQFVPGPGVSMYLGDLGADVIKVEPREGDQMRRMGAQAKWGENSPSFSVVNRSKKGITVDIRKPEGQEIVHKLAAEVDVVVVNLRADAAERLRMDYETLSRINPRLVYASVSAYGTRGPYAKEGGYDRILQGLAGVMHRSMPDGTPITAGVYAAVSATPMMLAYGVMVALWVREKTGMGQEVEASILHTWLALQLTELTRADDDPDPGVERADSNFGVYQCGDGKWINIAPNNDRQFARACEVLGMGSMLEDLRFKDPALRPQLRNEMHPKIADLFKTDSSDVWLEQLYEADIPAGPIRTRDEVFEEPQVLENEMLTEVQHPTMGRTRMVSVPLHFSATPAGIRRPAPRLSEHTQEVLGQLGYSAEQIASLKSQEVV
jgi:formyl-CoA transferase